MDTPGKGVDLISSLPSDVLLFIASKIPLKDAVRTAVLSTAWRNTLWRGTTSELKIGGGGSSESDQTSDREKLIDQIIGAFTMRFDYPDILKLRIANNDDCPEIVVTKGTQGELHFDFSGTGREEPVPVPVPKFNLVLESGFRVRAGLFSSVRSLHLRSVGTHDVARNLLTDLFSSCVFLESLALEKCRGLRNIEIRTTNNIGAGQLRNLRISDCFNVNSIKVVAPGLRAFFYRGILSTVELDTPQLVDASLNFRHGLDHNNFDCEDVLCLLFSLKDVERLTISGWLLDCLCTAGVIFGRLAFKFNKLKELVWMDSAVDARKRDSLACFLNNTPVLERLFLEVDKKLSPMIPNPILHEFWHEPHLWMDYAEVKCNASPLMHLKTIQLLGFRPGSGDDDNKEDDQLLVLLMDLLLHIAVNLKDMIMISPVTEEVPEQEIWRVTVTPRSQLQYVVRRSQKHKLIPSPNGYSLFVLSQVRDKDVPPVLRSAGLCLRPR